jgi:phenylpyruvate tautomerase PptA (4-oxalocrotonate tautomerase family)
MKEIKLYIDNELARKLTETAINGCHMSIEKYIIRVLIEDMDETERYFREEEGIEIFNFK